MSNNVDQKAEVRKQKRAERRKQVMKDRREGPLKICTLCEKPHYTRTHLCSIYNKRFKQIKKLETGISIVKLVTIQKDFPGENVWEVISEGRANPAVPLWNRRPEMMTYKREQRAEHRSEASYHRTFYNKEDQTNIPAFIFREMKRFPDRELVGISGERTNPYVYYTCQRCGEEQAIKYAELEQGSSSRYRGTNTINIPHTSMARRKTSNTNSGRIDTRRDTQSTWDIRFSILIIRTLNRDAISPE